MVPERQVKGACNISCSLKCHSTIGEDEREDVFLDYWGCGDGARQRDFICRNVEMRTPSAKAKEDVKRHRRVYFLPLKQGRQRVCQKFFINTLGIGEKLVSYTLLHKSGDFSSPDGRGKHPPGIKTSEEVIKDVRSHIESFPTMESHYCRKDSVKKYLSPNLNLAKMYSLYCERCVKNGRKPCSEYVYRQEFHTYNFAFHVPKKDMCNRCVAFSHLSPEEKAKEAETHAEHLAMKDMAQAEKTKDKERCSRDPSFRSYTFDLQQTLQTPSSHANLFYYKRKFSSYNLTVFCQSSKDATCFLWPETEGKRGSCEIGTCLMRVLNSLPAHVKHVSLFSDCCGGQNRNRFIAAGLSYITQTTNIEIIDQKFLESGHTHMEVDSIHSVIERAQKNVEIYHPQDWAAIIQMARKTKPYSVVQLHHTDFYDLKDLESTLFTNTRKDTENETVHWMKIKMIQYKKEDPTTLRYKYRYDEEFRCLRVKVTRRDKHITLKDLYKESLPVACTKKADLVSLCQSGVIPKTFHQFYQGMKDVDESVYAVED